MGRYTHRYHPLISFDPNFRPQVWIDLKQAKERIFVKAPRVQVVDTTGCGDGFTAASLPPYAEIRQFLRKHFKL